MTSFNTETQKQEAIEQAKQAAPVRQVFSAEQAKAIAEKLVEEDVVTNKLSGEARMFPMWRTKNASFYKYRVALVVAQLSNAGGQYSVDVDTLRNGVAVSMAGGYLKKDGTASAGTGAVARPKPIAGSGVWREYDQYKVINTVTGVLMLKKNAMKLGHIEEAKA